MSGKKAFLFVLFCIIFSMSLPAIDFNFGLVKEYNWLVTIRYFDESKDLRPKTRNGIPQVYGKLYTDPNNYEKGTIEIKVSARKSDEAEKKAVELWEKQKGRYHKFISANAIRLDT